MKAIIFFIFFIFLALPPVFGQIKIGDNPQNIDASSVLELESSSKVLVITRVNTLEMEAITPQRGGLVYNTDTECVHYYDGTQWVNLCDAVNFTITNDPIINGRSTIEITESAAGYNLEVAENSLTGDNIRDGFIDTNDIADNSLTADDLAAESVGSSEIRENAVGTNELAVGAIQPVNIANESPDRVLTTDENGIVQWEDANDLFDLTFDKTDNTLTISRSTTPGVSTISLEALVGSDDQQLDLTGNILSIENDPNTIDLSTYFQTLSFDPATNEITLSKGNTITLPAAAAEVDGIVGNEISNATDATLVRNGDGTEANPYTIDVEVSGIDTAELANNAVTTEKIANNAVRTADILNGTILPEDIAPSAAAPANAQILSTSTTGVVGWIDIPEGAAEVDGDVRNELQDLDYDPVNNILTISTPLTAGNQIDLSGLAGGGSPEVADQTTISGTGEAIDPFTIKPGANGEFLSTNVDGDVVWATPPGATGGTTEEADGTTISGTGTDSDPFTITPATLPITDNQVLITNRTTGLVQWADLPAGGGTVISDAVTITGNGTTGSELALAENAVTSDKIGADAILAEDINTGAVTTDEILDLTIISEDLADNAVTVNKINGGTDGQILTTTATGVSWEDADNNNLIVSEDADNSLTVSATDDGAYYDDSALTTAIAANTAAILLKENAINKSTDGTLIDNSDDDFPTEQAVKTYVDNEIDALTVGDNLSNSNLTQTIGENRTFEIGENDALIFTGLGRVGIGNGALSPQNKLHVAGTVRSEGFNSSQGSEGFPAYSFSTGDDIDTGMYRPAADEIGFSVGGFEALRIEEDADDTNVIVNQSLQLNNLLLDKDGESGAAGQILSSTGTQTDWINAPTAGTTYTEGNGITISAADEIGIRPLGVNTAELAENAVTTTKILDDNVTPDKLLAGANGQVLTTNAAGDVTWANPSNVATLPMGKVNADGTPAKILNSTVVRNSAGNYTVTFDTPRPDANYIVQLTIFNVSPDFKIQLQNQTVNGFTVSTTEMSVISFPELPSIVIENSTENGVEDHGHNAIIDEILVPQIFINESDSNWFFTISDF